MISPSGKTLIKRSEDSSSSVNEEQGGEDIISNKLPDALLMNILSLLPDPLDAIRTCILSKRWKHLWVFLPNLYFVLPASFHSAEQVRTFHDSVDNALALRCANNKLGLSWDFLKACSITLVELNLKNLCVLHVPHAEFLFSCLKKVNLISVEYLGNDQSPQNLISRCPVLQELSLESRRISYYFSLNPSQKFKISSPYLKRLRIQHCSFQGEVLIDAPRLEYLYIIEDEIQTKYSLTKPRSLVEAHVNKFCDTVVELLTCLSVAKGLMLANGSLWAIRYFHHDNVPTMFPNLVKLEVNIKCRWDLWSLLFNLLHKMPLLEQFTISNLHLPGAIDDTSGILSGEAPTCLRFKIKEIIIRNEGVVTQNQVFLIGYLLRHSTVLERLTLNAHDIDQKMCQQLLNFHCGSHICRIELL